MKSGKNVLEFEVLGFKVKFKPEGEDQPVSASEVVECVNNEANNLRNNFPQLSEGELGAFLLALCEKIWLLKKNIKAIFNNLTERLMMHCLWLRQSLLLPPRPLREDVKCLGTKTLFQEGLAGKSQIDSLSI